MKNTYRILLSFTVILLFSNLVVAQTIDDICEDGKGISTDPDNPVNLEATTETGRLNNFDWPTNKTIML